MKTNIYLCIVEILSVLALAQCDEFPREIMEVFEECSKEHGFTKDSFKEPPNFDDAKVKCFSACMLKKKDLLVNGKVIPNKVLDYGEKIFRKKPNDEGKKRVNECASKANEEKMECNVAGAFGKCFLASPHAS